MFYVLFLILFLILMLMLILVLFYCPYTYRNTRRKLTSIWIWGVLSYFLCYCFILLLLFSNVIHTFEAKISLNILLVMNNGMNFLIKVYKNSFIRDLSAKNKIYFVEKLFEINFKVFYSLPHKLKTQEKEMKFCQRFYS